MSQKDARTRPGGAGASTQLCARQHRQRTSRHGQRRAGQEAARAGGVCARGLASRGPPGHHHAHVWVRPGLSPVAGLEHTTCLAHRPLHALPAEIAASSVLMGFFLHCSLCLETEMSSPLHRPGPWSSEPTSQQAGPQRRLAPREKPLSAQRPAQPGAPPSPPRCTPALWPACHRAVSAASAWAPRTTEHRGTTAAFHVTWRKWPWGPHEAQRQETRPPEASRLLPSGPQRHAKWLFVLFSSDLSYSGAFN